MAGEPHSGAHAPRQHTAAQPGRQDEGSAAGFAQKSMQGDAPPLAAHTAAVSQLAGLKRRAASKRAALEQERASAAHSMEPELHHHVSPAVPEAPATSGASRADWGFTGREAEGMGHRSSGAGADPLTAAGFMHAAQGLSAPGSPVDASGSAGADDWGGHVYERARDPLHCLRELVAEVRLRSQSANIVAATWAGLQAHLSVGVPEPVVFMGPAGSSGWHAQHGVGSGSGSFSDHAHLGSRSGLPSEEPPTHPDRRSMPGVPLRLDADSAFVGDSTDGVLVHGREAMSSAGGNTAGAGHGGDIGGGGAESERIMSQLAGLRRRAAIRHTGE